MYNINISLNKPLMDSIKEEIVTKGYNNVSEFIRDALRHYLGISHPPTSLDYDDELVEKAFQAAEKDYRAGRYRALQSVDDLDK